MNTCRLLTLLLPLTGLLCGCAATRPLGAVLLGAGGAALGNELSGGDPALTAAGAAGGILLSEGAHYLARRETAKAYTSGYDQGRSDAVKAQYWLYVSLQRGGRTSEGRVRLYPVAIPEARLDGALIQPSVRTLRIVE